MAGRGRSAEPGCHLSASCMCHGAGAAWVLSQIAGSTALPDAYAAGLPLFHSGEGQDGSNRCELCASSVLADWLGFVCTGFFFYHSHRSQAAGFGRLVSSSARTPDLRTTHRKLFLVRRAFCVTSVIWLSENLIRRIYMKKLTMSVLSLAALMMLTFGSSFAKSAKADCCNGSSCCHSGAACCHRK